MEIYRQPKRNRCFHQGRGSWADKPFSNKTVREVGCGLVAFTNMAIETEQYKNATPNTFRKYMNQFTTPNHGVWGVHLTEAFQHIGLTDIKDFKGDILGGRMTPFFKELKKGDRVGIILFQNPLRDEGKIQTAPDGTEWAKTGHYVAVVGAKKVGKRFMLYIKDNDRSGWYGYKSMKGLVRWMWVGKI